MNHRRRLTVTVEEAGELMGVGRSTAYELVRSGDMPSLRLRRRIVVPIGRLADRLGLSVDEILWAVGDTDDLGHTQVDDPDRDVPTTLS